MYENDHRVCCPADRLNQHRAVQELESIGGPDEVTLFLACCYYYMQMFDKVGPWISCLVPT